jgi:hypothetical protein
MMQRLITWLVAVFISASAYGLDGQPLRYVIDWGPLELAELNMQLLAADQVESVEISVESKGVSTLFSDFRSSLEIMRTGDGLTLLNGGSSWGDAMTQLTVTYQADGSEPLVDYVRSKPRDYPISPIPENSTEDTVDPFVPVFEMARTLDASGRCEGRYAIFDGIRRYDITLTDQGDQTLIAKNANDYAGPAHVCEIGLTRIGGFSTERSLFQFGESSISRTLYFGQVRGHWVPVRFELDSPLGMAVARLVQDDAAVADRTQ